MERSTNTSVANTVDGYANVFTRGISANVAGLCGRIIRGRTESDFSTLTDDPARKVVMLMGPDGLSLLPGKSGYDMLTTIGYTPQHIERKVREGNRFRLVVFPESDIATPATWDGMLEQAGRAYPDAKGKLLTQAAALATATFVEIEDRAGYSFADVDVHGPADARYMSYERYITEPVVDDLVAARAFLYHTLHMRELYSGDGYTYTPTGERGLQEYAIPNERIDLLGEHVLLDLPSIDF